MSDGVVGVFVRLGSDKFSRQLPIWDVEPVQKQNCPCIFRQALSPYYPLRFLFKDIAQHQKRYWPKTDKETPVFPMNLL